MKPLSQEKSDQRVPQEIVNMKVPKEKVGELVLLEKGDEKVTLEKDDIKKNESERDEIIRENVIMPMAHLSASISLRRDR